MLCMLCLCVYIYIYKLLAMVLPQLRGAPGPEAYRIDWIYLDIYIYIHTHT